MDFPPFPHFFFSPKLFLLLPLKKILTCMCLFHQKNLKQLTVSLLRPHCCLNTYIPTTIPLNPLWVSLPHRLLAPPCPSKPLLIYPWTSFHQRQITPLSNVCCVVPKSIALPLLIREAIVWIVLNCFVCLCFSKYLCFFFFFAFMERFMTKMAEIIEAILIAPVCVYTFTS